MPDSARPEARANQVRVLIREMFGEEPIRVTHMDFGHQSLTFDVALPGQDFIVRTHGDAQRYAGTTHNLTTLTRMGLPVPGVLADDLSLSRFPFACLLLEKTPGSDLRDELATMTPAQMTRLAEQIVGFQKRVMALPAGNGFGYVPLGETGPFATLWDLLHRGETATVGTMEPRLAALIQRQEGHFRQARPICFLDDLTTKNVIMQDGKLQGLIDFDVVCYGDPRFWLGLTATVVASDVGEPGMFYANELRRLMGLTDEEECLVALYAAWISLGFVQKFGAAEDAAWLVRMTAAREQWLEAAGA